MNVIHAFNTRSPLTSILLKKHRFISPVPSDNGNTEDELLIISNISIVRWAFMAIKEENDKVEVERDREAQTKLMTRNQMKWIWNDGETLGSQQHPSIP